MSLRSGLPRDDERAGAGAGETDELPQLVVAVLGAVNHGKTRLVASLSQLLATRGWARALEPEALDQQACERERGLTVELSHAVVRTAERRYTLIDCPGHRDYLKNALTGVAEADAALLVVDVEAGPDEATRELALLAHHMGLETAVVFLSHADEGGDPEYRALVEADTRALLAACGYDADATRLIQGSALRAALALDAGEAPESAPELRPLWRLVEALDALPGQARADESRPPIMAVSDVIGHPEHGVVITGRLERGALLLEQEIELFGASAESPMRHPVRRMWSRHREVERAVAGELVGVALPWLQGHPGLRRGLVLGVPGALETQGALDVRLLTLSPELGERRYVGLHGGVDFHVFLRTAEVSARIQRPAPGFVRSGGEHRCTLALARPIVALPGWSLALCEPERTVALGRIASTG
ncbi:MAG: 50S ribosome-binding GTPase [Myxococcales bacterium]|nr:50S ribosome-binding GTPase [Myxococcales bacterium]